MDAAGIEPIDDAFAGLLSALRRPGRRPDAAASRPSRSSDRRSPWPAAIGRGVARSMRLLAASSLPIDDDAGRARARQHAGSARMDGRAGADPRRQSRPSGGRQRRGPVDPGASGVDVPPLWHRRQPDPGGRRIDRSADRAGPARERTGPGRASRDLRGDGARLAERGRRRRRGESVSATRARERRAMGDPRIHHRRERSRSRDRAGRGRARCSDRSWRPGVRSWGRPRWSRGTTGSRSARPDDDSTGSCLRIGCCRSTGRTSPRSARTRLRSGSATTSCRGPGGRSSRSRSRSGWG